MGDVVGDVVGVVVGVVTGRVVDGSGLDTLGRVVLADGGSGSAPPAATVVPVATSGSGTGPADAWSASGRAAVAEPGRRFSARSLGSPVMVSAGPDEVSGDTPATTLDDGVMTAGSVLRSVVLVSVVVVVVANESGVSAWFGEPPPIDR